ncbi:protein strawberry notch-like protein 2-like isoform X1 [Huso huso]|uniref:Protein strawberry notch-like protein 2-like isoform X1 n=1 Tax=Huso huso TaxID=61971 RepID=A0ABR0Y443_HUSHU
MLLVSTHPVMDGENYLHPEGPLLDSPMFSLSNPSLLPTAMENHMSPSSSWATFSSHQATYNLHYPMQSGNQQYFNTTSEMPMETFSPHHFQDGDLNLTSHVRNGDFSQDLSYFEELSNNSLFSSPTDSLSEYADNQGFLNSDSLNQVPTIWDVSTPSQPPELNPSRFQGINSLEELSAIINAPPLGGYQIPPQPIVEEEEEVDNEEAEEMGHAETYADYKPSKSTIGNSHPDIVVETSTLSSVPPPNITYTVSIPDSTINNGLLSALQLEAIIYSCQQHEVILQNGQRAGFLVGDGAGVGKGRTVAGIILENYLNGRKKALWFSVSNDLKYDAERDLKDIDAPNIPVHALNKIKYGDTATSEGVLFATYSALIGESQAGGQHRTRLKQILDWCGERFDGVIVFDECHKAKNATSTKMGKAVLDLQNKLPLARVVYASATGASEPKNMIYMSRLGIWGDGTPFRTFEDFLHTIEKRGVGAMEIVAMDMKVSGMYIARQLSFAGVSFRVEEISLDKEYMLVYNKAARLWAEALAVFLRAADLLGLESRKSLWGQFWSAHQRFFKYLCIAAKVRRLVELANKELADGKCIVIGLQSTGEARTREVLDENDGRLNRFVSAAEGVFQSLVQKHFPTEKRKREKGPANKRKRKPKGRQTKFLKHCTEIGGVINISDDSSTESDVMDSDSNSSPDSLHDNDDVIFVDHINCYAAKLQEMKQDLLNKIAVLGQELPLNTLDALIDKLGGPNRVAEMTGRKGRVVRMPDGSVRYESRAEQGLSIDHVNIKEKERFMSGEKFVAIISEAASSGISLQADRRIKNQRRRVHMTLELPWSADRAIQQFGRTHRSNQINAPEYIFLISELAGERRFASIVAKRLESLGALTHGDRRATESRDLSKYNFENKYGTRALDKIIKAIMGQIESKVPTPKGYPGGDAMFFRDMKRGLMDVGIFCKEPRFGVGVEKDCSITKFLNRILGLEVYKQNSLFQYFTDNFDYLIEKDKKEGKYDLGILDLAPGNDEIYEETQEKFLTPGNPQDGQVVLYKITVDRGMKWEEALSKFEKLTGPDDGFYLSYKLRGTYPNALLAEQGRGKNFNLYKANIGKQVQHESLDNLFKRYRKVSPEEAKDAWESQYSFSRRKCSHATWNGECKLIREGKECWQGMRLRQYYMLCGALLRVWKKVADAVSDITSSSILQIVRLKTKQHTKQVGIKIPESCIARVREELTQMNEALRRKIEERQEKARREERELLEKDFLEKLYAANASVSDSRAISTQPLDLSLTQPMVLHNHYSHSLDVLDLTISPIPLQDSSAGLGLEPTKGSGSSSSGSTAPQGEFSLESLIAQPQQQQLQSSQVGLPSLITQNFPGFSLDSTLGLPQSYQLPSQLAITDSAAAPAAAPAAACSGSASSSASLSLSSSSQQQQPGFLQTPQLSNGQSELDAINIREVLDNMFRTTQENQRQSVIQYGLMPFWDDD